MKHRQFLIDIRDRLDDLELLVSQENINKASRDNYYGQVKALKMMFDQFKQMFMRELIQEQE